MFDMEDGHFELQACKGVMGADVRESLREFLWRGVGGESFYWIRSGGAESLGYRIQVVRIPSENRYCKVSMRWVCEYSTDAFAASRSLVRKLSVHLSR